MAIGTSGASLQEITNPANRELPELHLKPEEIAAIKLSIMELCSKVTVNQHTGLEETGMERVTRKAYKIDPLMTKMLFGAQAVRKFEVDAKTGLRINQNGESGLHDDLAYLDAVLERNRLDVGLQQSRDSKGTAQKRSKTTPPIADPATESAIKTKSATSSSTKMAAASGDAAVKDEAKAAGRKRSTSRPRRQKPGTMSQLMKSKPATSQPEVGIFAATDDKPKGHSSPSKRASGSVKAKPIKQGSTEAVVSM